MRVCVHCQPIDGHVHAALNKMLQYQQQATNSQTWRQFCCQRWTSCLPFVFVSLNFLNINNIWWFSVASDAVRVRSRLCPWQTFVFQTGQRESRERIKKNLLCCVQRLFAVAYWLTANVWLRDHHCADESTALSLLDSFAVFQIVFSLLLRINGKHRAKEYNQATKRKNKFVRRKPA